MATGSVISPFFLPWHQQGVEFLLQEKPVATDLSLCHAHTQKKATILPSAAPRATQYAQPVAPRPVAPAQIAPTQPKTLPRQMPTYAPAQNPPRQTQVQTQHENAPAGAPPQNSFTQEQWPIAWQERFQQTKRARVVWTYWQLGNDLCGEANEARRHFIRDMLGKLDLPPGTHSFWPVALPNTASPHGELEANVPVFWAGIRQLDARVLIILGEQTATTLGYKPFDMAMKTMHKQGKLAILVRDMETLMEKQHLQKMLIDYLQEHLTQYLQLR